MIGILDLLKHIVGAFIAIFIPLLLLSVGVSLLGMISMTLALRLAIGMALIVVAIFSIAGVVASL